MASTLASTLVSTQITAQMISNCDLLDSSSLSPPSPVENFMTKKKLFASSLSDLLATTVESTEMSGAPAAPAMSVTSVTMSVAPHRKSSFIMPSHAPPAEKFALDLGFLKQMQQIRPPWEPSNGKQTEDVLAALVYYRTYSRGGERWWKCIQRVVEGCFRIQQEHYGRLRKAWKPRVAQKLAQEMYVRMFKMKFLPPGRGLWAMGTPIIEEKGLVAALNNCAFVSTKDLDKNPCEPFTFMMDASMLGVGVGADLKGAGKLKIFKPVAPGETFVIPDTREGWVESVRLLIHSHCKPNRIQVKFDYSAIRKEGVPLTTFGGISAGPGPLIKLHKQLRETLGRYIGTTLDSRGIADIFNLVGAAVVSGNIRRSAEILFGEANDKDFLNLKNADVFPERNAHGTGWSWMSNNSLYARLGMDYTEAAERIVSNGEPGFIWLENSRNYSRMRDTERDGKDYRVGGANPCVEQSLESWEMCNLVEVFPNHHKDMKDYLESLRCACLYVKTVTLLPSHWEKTNEVMMRNRRIGVSLSGLAQFLATRSLDELKDWMTAGYDRLKELDKEFSEMFCVPLSIKMTTIKPSGTVSLIAGATPGMHFPISNYYIRRVTLSRTSEYVSKLAAAGYKIETSVYDPDNSVVVEIPVSAGDKVRFQRDVSMWEQLSLAAFIQRHWADNQVSCTVTFDREREGPQIPQALNYFQYQLKSISFLPSTETSKTYKIFGKLADEHAAALSEEDANDSHKLFSLPRMWTVKYKADEDATFIEFDCHATEKIISKTLEAIGAAGYRVDSHLVTPYKQMPYEPISKEEYTAIASQLKPVKWDDSYDDSNNNNSSNSSSSGVDAAIPDSLMYCDSERCIMMSV